MSRKTQGLNTTSIDAACTGVEGKKVLYRHGVYGLGLSVDRRYGTVRKAFFFEGKLHGRTVRRVIGSWPTWTVQQAEKEARELRVKLDRGIDPRDEERDAKAKKQQETAVERARRVTLGEVWAAYLANRAASVKTLSALTVRDYDVHLRRSFADWRDRKLTTITPTAVLDKHKALVETSGPAQGNQAMRYLRAVLNFAARRPEFAVALSDGNPVHKLTEDGIWADVRPNSTTLRRDQLTSWWDGTELIENPVARAYLRFLLLTGCRREEALSLKWTDIDYRWRSITFSNVKTGGDRSIPMTNYVSLLLQCLPRRNEWVFASERSAEGRMREPAKAVKKIGIKTGVYMPSHGLRKSFATLSEWIEIPSGVIRQITGHVAGNDAHERHYRHRPLDLLALHLQRYEDWLLIEAGQEPVKVDDDPGLRLVR